MSNFLSKLKDSWLWIVSIITALITILYFKDKYDSALAKDKLHDSELKDKDLQAEEKVIKESMSRLEEEKKKALEKANSDSKKQVEDFYKK